MVSKLIRYRFISIEGRRVRYLRAGYGSPVVLIYPNAATLPELVEHLSRRWTVFAFDNPGYCGSDPLEPGEITMADIADALAACLRAMKFPKTPVVGSHLGAAVGVELGVRHPDLVAGLVLDGVPMFTRDEVEAHDRDGYFYRLEPRLLGGHLTDAWTRTRDWLAFDPWCSRTPEHQQSSGPQASAQSLHNAVSMFFQYAREYERPYREAFRFGEVAAERVAALDVATVFTATSTDGLSKQFSRLPPLQDSQILLALGPDRADLLALVDDQLDRFDAGAPAPADPPPEMGGPEIGKAYVDLPCGQIFVRCCGAATHPPLLLLHDAPGSTHALEPLIKALGSAFRVIAPDLPGCGASDPLPGTAPGLARYSEAMELVCAHFDLVGATVYGIGFGSSLALEFTQSASDLAARVVLRGLLLPDANERQDMQVNYAPPIIVDATGGHWYQTWLMLRDSLIYWPWYRRGPSAMRRASADFGADRLHDWTVEVMRQRGSYQHLIDACLAHDAAAAIKSVRAPLLIAADCRQAFFGYGETLTALAPDAPTFDPWDSARAVQAILDFAQPAPKGI